MPLSFRSLSHGEIAFGFFNIESDMLLLEQYFFFAGDFCCWMIQLAEPESPDFKKISVPVYYIADPVDIGDLMGAIHGIRYQGFIGRVYQQFPFPEDPEAFRQNPGGDQTREIVGKLIQPVSTMMDMDIEFLEENQVGTGPFRFEIPVFHELIRYVWRGGYPRWKDDIMPSYVSDMKAAVLKSSHPFFKGI